MSARTYTAIDEYGHAVSAQVSFAILAPAARYNRIDYTNPTPVDPAPRSYGSVVLENGSASAAWIKSFKASDPGVRVFMYAAFVVNTSDRGGWAHAITSDFITDPVWGGLNHSWFVIDPLTRAPLTAGGMIFLDITQATLQQAILSHVSTQAKAAGFDGVFWDGVDAALGLGALKAQPTSPTAWVQSNANYVAGMGGFLSAMGTGLHAKGLLHLANIGGAGLNASGAALWRQWNALLDGALEECWCATTSGAAQGINQWSTALSNFAWSEANGKLAIANGDDAGNTALATFGLGSLLLVAGGSSQFCTSRGHYSGGPDTWLAAYGRADALGAPLGPAAQQPSGLWQRQFAGGVVTVNPTPAAIAGLPAHSATF